MTPGLDEDKVFIVHRGAIITRLDPRFHQALRAYSNLALRHNSKRLKTLISSMFSGGTPNTQNPAYWNGSIPWISPKDFGAFEMNSAIDQITPLALNESNAKLAPVNSVLLVVRSGILQHTIPIGIANSEVAINQDVKAIICNSSCSPYYLATYFRCFQDNILPVITKFGATVQSINTAELNNLAIPLPDKKKQDEIVTIYRRALIEKARLEEKSKDLLCGIDDYLLSELGLTLPPEPANTIANRIFFAQRQELAGWRFDPLFHNFRLWHAIEEATVPTKKLGLCCQYLKTGFAAGGDMQLFDNDGVVQLRPTNIDANRELVFGRNVYLDSSVLIDRPGDVVRPGEVIFNNTNSQELVGKTAYMDICDPSFVCSNHMTRIAVINDELDAEYLAALLNAYQRLKVFFSLCTNWNNQSGVNVDLLRQLPIPLPRKEKQIAISAHIRSIRNEAKRLRQTAEDELDAAKLRIEAMLLGEQIL